MLERLGVGYHTGEPLQQQAAFVCRFQIAHMDIDSILDPGRVPKVEGVTRFPSHEEGRILSLSKVPSVLYYDSEGNLKAVGAETLAESVKQAAHDEQWTKVEWYVRSDCYSCTFVLMDTIFQV